jgi:hypothetical protein
MTKERYWVVGGDYEDLRFDALKDGAGQMLGPFADREAARDVWRRLSREHSARATARFSIASEQIVLPAP